MACRTRLSESGGWFVLIQKVTVRVAGTVTIFVARPSAMLFMRSGGTLVMMSASPFSSATIPDEFPRIVALDARCLAFPPPPVPVGLHHEPLVLDPLDEAVGPGADRAPRQLLDAVVRDKPRGQDLGAHLRHPHR